MRKIITILLAALLCVSLAIPVWAVSEPEDLITEAKDDDLLLIDEAELLTDGEEEELLSQLQKLSKKYDAHVAVVTVSELYDDIDDFVNDLYDDLDYGYGSDRSGVLLLVCMDPWEFRIFSNGDAQDAIDGGVIDDISNEVQPQLSDGDYADAFETFAEQCEYYLEGHKNGFPFDVGQHLVIALIIGAVVGIIVVLIFKAQLKSVRSKDHADAYVRPGSMNITLARDIFLYRNVTRRPKPQNNSSSSGSRSSRSVGGGRF